VSAPIRGAGIDLSLIALMNMLTAICAMIQNRGVAVPTTSVGCTRQGLARALMNAGVPACEG